MDPTGPSPATTFPKFLELPAEIKLRIYKIALACGERLIIKSLDPVHLKLQDCLEREERKIESWAVLQTCKELRHDCISIIYGDNTVNISSPSRYASLENPLMNALGAKPLRRVQSLELPISYGIEELGKLWPDVLAMKKLKSLKLIYDSHSQEWLRSAAACIATDKLDVPEGRFGPTLHIELLERTSNPEASATGINRDDAAQEILALTHTILDNPLPHGLKYFSSLPTGLRDIVLSGTVPEHTTLGIQTFEVADWHFKRLPDTTKHCSARRAFVWDRRKKQHHEHDTAIVGTKLR